MFEKDRNVTSISNLKSIEPSGKYSLRKIEEIRKEVDSLRGEMRQLKEAGEGKKGGTDKAESLQKRIDDLEDRFKKMERQVSDLEELTGKVEGLESFITADRFLLRGEYEAGIEKIEGRLEELSEDQIPQTEMVSPEKES